MESKRSERQRRIDLMTKLNAMHDELHSLSEAGYADMEGADSDEFRIAEAIHVHALKASVQLAFLIAALKTHKSVR